MKPFIKLILPVGLAVALLVYALKDTSLNEIAGQFRGADYRYLLLAGILIVLQNVVRAARWLLTLQALNYHPSLFRATVAVLAGTLASMIAPGAGELTRCGTLQRTDDVPLAQGIGSVVAERVIDLLMMGLLTGLTLLLEFRRIGQFISNSLLPLLTRRPGTIVLIVGLGGLVGLGVLYALLQTKSVRQHRFVRRVAAVGRSVGEGFLAIRKLRQPGLFMGLTFAGYVFAYLTTYVLFFASPQTVSLPPSAALTILTVSALSGLAVPTQGGLGTYHFFVSRVLVQYGLTKPLSVAVTTFLHAVQTGFTLLLSSFSFLVIPILIRHRKKASGNYQPRAVPPVS